MDMESKIVEPDFRWTLDASIIGSNPGVTKERKFEIECCIEMPCWGGEGGEEEVKHDKNYSGVGLRPSSTDEKIDSSMFVFEVILFFFLSIRYPPIQSNFKNKVTSIDCKIS